MFEFCEVKMPVIGLPIAVEGALNNLLTSSHISSWKLQGQGKFSTLVLKFIDNDEEGIMADKQPVNIFYKKKSQGQIRKEKQRAYEYREKQQQKQSLSTSVQEQDYKKDGRNTDSSKEEQSTVRPTNKEKDKEEKVSEVKEASFSAPATHKSDETTLLNKCVTSRLTNVDNTPEPVATEKEHSQVPVTQSCNLDLHHQPCLSLEDAKNKLKARYYEPEMISQQVRKMSMRMKKQYVDKERNTKLSFVCAYEQDGIEELVAETDDYLLRYWSDDVKKKTFIVKNSSMYRMKEEEQLMHIIWEGPLVNREHYTQQLQEMTKDLLLITKYIQLDCRSLDFS